MAPNRASNIFAVSTMIAERIGAGAVQPTAVPARHLWRPPGLYSLLLLMLLVTAAGATGRETAPGIMLVYSISYQNLPLGRVHYQLQKGSRQWWVISQTEPNLLASMSSRSKRQETTSFQWSRSGLVPQQVDIADYRGPDTKILIDWQQQKIIFPDQRTVAIPQGPLYTTMAMVYGIAFTPPTALKPGKRLAILSEKTIEIYTVAKVSNAQLQVKAGKFSSVLVRATRLGVAGDRIDLWLTTDSLPMIVRLDKYRNNKRTRFQLLQYRNWPPAQFLLPTNPSRQRGASPELDP